MVTMPGPIPGATGRNASRGQLIVITAIALAVLLVIIAIALNTAVMGGIHAEGAGDTDLEERNAVQYASAVEAGLPGLFVGVNEGNMTYDEREGELEDQLDNWNRVLADSYARDGVRTDIATEDMDIIGWETELFHDDDDESFGYVDGDDLDGTLAENVTEVEVFEVTISMDDTEPEFTVVDADDKEWKITTEFESGQDEEDDDELTVTILNDGDEEDSETITEGEEITINLITEDVEDGELDFDSFVDNDDFEKPFEITIEEGEALTGTYHLRVKGTLDHDVLDEFNDPDPDEDDVPWYSANVVGAEVDVSYHSSTVRYGTTVTAGEEVADDD